MQGKDILALWLGALVVTLYVLYLHDDLVQKVVDFITQ